MNLPRKRVNDTSARAFTHLEMAKQTVMKQKITFRANVHNNFSFLFTLRYTIYSVCVCVCVCVCVTFYRTLSSPVATS